MPILGYIPFIGRLFRHVETTTERRNLVILIRPTILDDDEPDTGFEQPTLKVIEPLNAESGRNLKDVKVGDNDPLFRNEKAVKSFFGFGGKEGEGEAAESAEDKENAAEDAKGEAEDIPETDAAAPQGKVADTPKTDANTPKGKVADTPKTGAIAPKGKVVDTPKPDANAPKGKVADTPKTDANAPKGDGGGASDDAMKTPDA